MSRVAELRNELEWRRCSRSAAYFIENYCNIRVPGKGRILFKLRPAQSETLATVQDNERTIILKARQIGYSTLFACFALWLVLFHQDEYIVFLSKGEREAIKLLAKTLYAYKFLPEWMKRRGPQIIAQNQQKLAFDNESVIESLPSKSDPARGESVTWVFVDEWAFLENPEAAWASIEPIADVGGKIVGLSTANGWGEFFHTMWVRARTGASDFVPLFYPYDANTDRDEAWYAHKASNNPGWFMAQEYPRTEEEAFLKSGNPVFDLEMIAAITPRPPVARGRLVGQAYAKQFRLEEQPNGHLQVWEYPQAGEAYVVGADVAEGLEHGDYSSAHVIKVRTWEVVAKWHGHIEADVFGEEILYPLGYWYNLALVGVENNNHGLSTLSALRRVRYPRIFYQKMLDHRTNRTTTKMGWSTARKSKALLVDELAGSIRTADMLCYDEQTLAELKTFVRDPDGKMHGSPYDDQVMSLGIARQMLKYAHAPTSNYKPNDYMTGDWWERQLEKPPKSLIIGNTAVRQSA